MPYEVPQLSCPPAAPCIQPAALRIQPAAPRFQPATPRLQVPQFLHTCVNTTKDEAKMLGCSIQPSTASMIKQVVELAVRWP